MIVHRFMSEAEYDCLISGAKLMNATDHSDEAIHWLSGCTYPDKCVTMEIPDSMLKESYGIYRDPKKEDLKRGPVVGVNRPTMRKREYCLTSYSINDVRILSVTDRYVMYAHLRRDLERLRFI